MNYHPSFGQRINILDRLYAKRLNERIQNTGLTASRWVVVSCLMFQAELTQAEICEQLSIEPPSISRTLELMEKNGWIKRSVAASDKREKRITLTDKARKHLPFWSQTVTEVQNQAFNNIPPKDIDVFGRVLDKIITNLQLDE